VRKLALTAGSSSRWAGAITRISEDAWQLAARNLVAERSSLKARITAITKRLAVPAGQKKGRTRGYPTQAGRDHTGRRPARGAAGRRFRRLTAGIPTGRFRDRLAQMAASTGIAVVAVDPAYTSIWGAQHWLAALKQASPDATGHHAAALVIGRRALGQRARRRERCDWRRPEDRRQRATNSAVRPTPAPAGLARPRPRKPGTQKAHGQPYPRRKTPTANRAPPGYQVTEDRSPPPTGQDSLLPSV
jgi:hypothetical protein